MSYTCDFRQWNNTYCDFVYRLSNWRGDLLGSSIQAEPNTNINF